MTAFDNNDYKTYKSDVEERWGNTDAFFKY